MKLFKILQTRTKKKFKSMNKSLMAKFTSTTTLAAFLAKKGESPHNPPKLYFDYSYDQIAHFEKKHLKVSLKDIDNVEISSFEINGAGEDSVMASKRILAVSDGVGGWALHSAKANSALFSRLILNYLGITIEKFFSETHKNGLSSKELHEFITKAHSLTNRHDILGSATLCFCSLNGDRLISVNVGDSGFMVLRNGKVVETSKEQIVGFNCPNQLGPDKVTSMPFDFYQTQVRMNDIVVLFTDGVSDNIFKEDIASIALGLSSGGKLSPKKLSQKLCQYALQISKSGQIVTPFALKANQSGYAFKGGKEDDISVVVGVVKFE